MILNFNHLHAKNFLSLGDVEVDLDNQGTVIVKGINNSPGSSDSNGSGKSSIFEALYYALTGNTLRGSKDVQNFFTTEKSVEVELTFELDSINYKVLRTRNHPKYGNNLKIWKNDQGISGDKLTKSESILADELGSLNANLVSGIIILGQAVSNNFTSLKPKDRKEKLEMLSQSDEFIKELELRLKKFITLYNSKVNDIKVQIGKKETETEMLRSLIKKNSAELHELSSSKSIDIPALNKELDSLVLQDTELRTTINTYRSHQLTFDSKIRELQSIINTHQVNKMTSIQSIKKLNQDIMLLNSSTCPTCKQWINSPTEVARLKQQATESTNQYQNMITEADENIKLYTNQLNVIKTKLSQLDEELADCQSKLIALTTRINEIKLLLTSTQNKVDKLSTELEQYNKRLNKTLAELEGLTSIKNEYELKNKIFDYLKRLASKEFRGYLLSGIISFLNDKLQYYCEKLFSTKDLRMELDGNNILIIYDGRLYEALSGGEKKRSDICIQLSLRDMLIYSLGFVCNVIVLDEVFENLDEPGVQAVNNLIDDIGEVNSKFVISHTHINLPSDKTLVVTKDINKISSVRVQ